MKRLLLTCFLSLCWLVPTGSLKAQPTSVFEAKDNSGTKLFQLNDDAGLVVRGTFGMGMIPAEGEGSRLMWHPAKAAFRAGHVDGREWAELNMGNYSMAFGHNTEASGQAATAMGFETVASNDHATTMGRETEASGYASTAMGAGTTASGTVATTMGLSTEASGFAATAMGFQTTAQAYASLVIGQYNVIEGSSIFWNSGDPLFVAGNGVSNGNPSNALTLLKNGNMTIAGTLTQNSDVRLKESIEPLQDVRQRLARLQPITYRFKEGTNRPRQRQIGLLAQDMEQVFPELVSRGADGYLSVAYGNLTAVLVEALNEQQQDIEHLRQELDALRALVLRMTNGE